MGKKAKHGASTPPASTPTSAPPSGVARQLLAGVLSAALALGAGQLLSAVTASPPPPGASSSSAAPPSAAGPIAVGATELDHFDAAHNASLQWGTWRPGEYFGLRSRTAPSQSSTDAQFPTVRCRDSLQQRPSGGARGEERRGT